MVARRSVWCVLGGKRSRAYAGLLAAALVLAGAGAVTGAPAAQAVYLGSFMSPPAVAWTGTGEVLAATDTAASIDALDYWWQNAPTGAWTEETVAKGNFSTTSAIGWTGSGVVIAATGNDGHLYFWWQAAYTTTWHQETVSTGNFLFNGAPGGDGGAAGPVPSPGVNTRCTSRRATSTTGGRATDPQRGTSNW